MNSTDILRILTRAEKFAHDPRHKPTITEATILYNKKEYQKASEVLNKLPTNERLLEELIEKLKGKSVYTNVQKLVEGKVNNKYSALKTYSSLLTHAAIEAEQGRVEATLLFETILQKIYKLL